jgi:hypothetical protein
VSVTPKTRKAVYERDGNRCVACGDPNNLTLQHRVSKGMGGSKLYDQPAYLVTMCLTCNVGLESNYNKAETGRFNGWKISRLAKPAPDPEKIPVRIGMEWFLLDNQGGKTPITNKEIR